MNTWNQKRMVTVAPRLGDPETIALLLLVGLIVSSVSAEPARDRLDDTVTYPAPAGVTLSADYEVMANGKPVAVYKAPTWQPDYAPPFGGPYSFAYFDFAGRVEVRITTKKPLDKVTILPHSRGIIPEVKGDTLTFTLTGPCQLSIEPEGKRGPLLLFANPLETDPPNPGDPKVRYFGPGLHEPGAIELRSGETLYIAGGAVVKGGIHACGANITIRGRGIFDGLDWERFKGPTKNPVDLDHCTGVAVEGIILKDSWSWTFNIRGCRDVMVRNLKICSARCENNDGIDICNSRQVTIEDCFIRSDDDCIAPKGFGYADNQPVDGLAVRRSVLWTDRANVWRIGCECRAEGMRNMLFEDIDVIHFCEIYWGDFAPVCITLQPAEDMPLEKVRFENIRIHADENPSDARQRPKFLIEVRPQFTHWAKTKTPGRIRDCVFKDITVFGDEACKWGRIQVSAQDAEHSVDNVTFENVTRFGQPVTRDAPEVEITGSVSNVAFQRGGKLSEAPSPSLLRLPPASPSPDPALPRGPVKAFPTAEGFGADAVGGRGGRVIEVTNLNDSGDGSLRRAMEASGPRICVFRVSGTITLKSAIRVSSPYLTVAGQTSPGGVQIKGTQRPDGDWGVWFVNGAHDIVLRHLRVRMGGNMQHDAGNNILFYGTAEPGVHDVIVDHCSVSWGSDTQLDWYGSYLNRATFQWNIIAEADMGNHIGGNRAPKNITLHHNLYANLGSRTPLMQHASVFDFRNNVIYNWNGNNASVFGQFALNASAFGNVVNNLWLAGPESGYPYINVGNGGPVRIDGSAAEAGGTKVYLSGNWGPRSPTGCTNDWIGHGVNTWDYYERNGDGSTHRVEEAQYGAPEPFSAPSVTLDPVSNLLDKVLAAVGGYKPSRDAIDLRIVKSVRDKTGTYRVNTGGPWPDLATGAPAPPDDSDHDGMPDVWEKAHALDPNNASDGAAFAANGYTNVENYLNELAGDPIPGSAKMPAASPLQHRAGKDQT